jgi:hypothetical protein
VLTWLAPLNANHMLLLFITCAVTIGLGWFAGRGAAFHRAIGRLITENIRLLEAGIFERHINRPVAGSQEELNDFWYFIKHRKLPDYTVSGSYDNHVKRMVIKDLILALLAIREIEDLSTITPKQRYELVETHDLTTTQYTFLLALVAAERRKGSYPTKPLDYTQFAPWIRLLKAPSPTTSRT